MPIKIKQETTMKELSSLALKAKLEGSSANSAEGSWADVNTMEATSRKDPTKFNQK